MKGIDLSPREVEEAQRRYASEKALPRRRGACLTVVNSCHAVRVSSVVRFIHFFLLWYVSILPRQGHVPITRETTKCSEPPPPTWCAAG